jgi:hypothetical protein
MITLRFVSHPGIFNWACQIAQYGFWPTHVEAVMPEGKLLGAMSDGVKSRDAHYDAGKCVREKFVQLRTSEGRAASFHAFLRSQIGKPYDTWAIVSFYSKRQGRDWQAPDSWFCSELIAKGLAACGLFPAHLADEFSRITPRDLLLLISTQTEAG